MTKFSLLAFLREQLAAPVPLVTNDLSGKIVLVTGSNTGLGLEAAKHFASMNPERLILACRNEAKGRKAVEDIKEVTGHKNVELRLVDFAKFESVNEFCDKVEKEVPRLDILVANAGMTSWKYVATSDGWEQQLQVNHLGTVQVSLLLLPLLRRTASLGSIPRLVIVASDTHIWAGASTTATADRGILQTLNDKEYLTHKQRMRMQYPKTKTLNVLFTRELASRLPTNSPLIVNCLTPGLSKSELRREFNRWPLSWIFVVGDAVITWSTERGSRQLIFAALGYENQEDELKGVYISSSKITEPSDFIISDEGKAAQKQAWNETMDVLYKVSPKLQSIVQSLGV